MANPFRIHLADYCAQQYPAQSRAIILDSILSRSTCFVVQWIHGFEDLSNFDVFSGEGQIWKNFGRSLGHYFH